jgi:uncharacterized protein
MERNSINSIYPNFDLAVNPKSLSRVDMLAPVCYQGEGFVPLGDFPRLRAESGKVEPSDGFDCLISGKNFGDKPLLKIRIHGGMHLVCQRCLQPLALSLDIQKTYVFLKTEEQADHFPLDRDDEEAMVQSSEFDLFAALEDEVLLALPHAPKHPDGKCQLDHSNVTPDKPNPFKVLKNLKK